MDDRDPAAALTGVSVVACSARDREEQARLFNACFKKRIDADGLRWRYDRSPHGASISFVSRTSDHGAVSGYACSPRLAWVHGDERTLAAVGETGDVMTHPAWRKRGLFSALDRAAMAESRTRGWPVVFGLPNQRSAHIFVELGWRAVGTVRPWTFVFRADAAARAARSREGRWKGLTTWLGARACAARRKSESAAAARVRSESLAHFPESVLTLAQQVAERHAWMVRRDAAYLNWRFIDTPSRLHRAVGLYEDAALVGYVVVQVPRPGTFNGYLVDLLARDESVERAAVEAGLQALESAGASYAQATAIDGSWWSRRLEASGFLPPRGSNHLSVIVHPHQADHPLAVAAMDPARWYLTDGDRDDETMG
ncbi:MAG: GNAT family N-acetyltransferase [Planctomycetes bacterium]|nr:GNAT family N-acetyltransferase [Planctomycetota bacterium]